MRHAQKLSIREVKMSRPTVFVSYSHKDLPVLKDLLPYLSTLERDELIEIWSDENLRGGERWRDAIHAALDAAAVAVLLISQEFLASKFIYKEELPRILERQAKAALSVLPVYLSPSTVNSDKIPFTDAQQRRQQILLSEFQGFGTPSRPLSSLKPAERKRVFVELHDRIQQLARGQTAPSTSSASHQRPRGEGRDTTIQRPRVRHVPFLRNRNFTGRVDYLRKLHSELAGGKPEMAIQALAGLGGIGKTQLALEYSYRYAAEYDVLWWIRSEYDDVRREDMKALGAELGAESEVDPDRAVKATIKLLERCGDWLLVFDNAEHPDVIRPLLPQAGRGHIIITSRYPAWGEIARVQRIDVWKPKEATAYLSRRTGLAPGKAAAATASALGNLPLALAQVASYIEETGSGFDGYLDLLRRRPADTLKLTAHPPAAQKAVASVWDIALERVGASNPAAVDLLNLLSFLPSDGISRSLLLDGADRLPSRLQATIRDQFAFDASIGALRRYSLIDTTPDAFSVHRLVQTVVQTRLDTKSRQVFYEAAAFLEDQRGPGARRGAAGGLSRNGSEVGAQAEEVATAAPRLWLERTVPYFISPDMSRAAARMVRQAIAHFEERTVLRFTPLAEQPARSEACYIGVRKGEGDASSVGMIGGQQTLLVSGRSLGATIHSFGHAVGLWHEHSRADRDKYVTIVWENIGPEYRHNFEAKLSGHERIRPYDYASIMHDSRDAFSRNGRPTIVPKEDLEIGQRVELSAGDVFLINTLYGDGAT